MKPKKTSLSKAEERELLSDFCQAAREARAEYLAEALAALALPFASVIYSDYPGALAVDALLDATKAARETLAQIRKEVETARENLRQATEEAQRAKRETERANNDLAECRAIARRLATV
jgi:chromosome segregation ATPase